MRPFNYILIGVACIVMLGGALILVGQDSNNAVPGASEERLLKETTSAAAVDTLPAELDSTTAPAPAAAPAGEAAPVVVVPEEVKTEAPAEAVPAEVAAPAAVVPEEVKTEAPAEAVPAEVAAPVVVVPEEVKTEVPAEAVPAEVAVPAVVVPAEVKIEVPIEAVPAEVAAPAVVIPVEAAKTEVPTVVAPVVPDVITQPVAQGTEPAAVVVVTPEMIKKRLDSATDLAKQEEVRRKVQAMNAQKIFANAEELFEAKEYTNALASYRDVVKFMPDRPENSIQRKRALTRINECEYRYVLSLLDAGRNDDAVRVGEQMLAAKPDNLNVKKVVDKAKKQIKQDEAAGVKKNKGLAEDESEEPAIRGLTETQRRIRRNIRNGKNYIAAKNFAKAKLEFEAVLALEPQNKEAMGLLEGLAQKKYSTSTLEQKATSKAMMADVRATWNPPDYKEIKPHKDVEKDKKPDDKKIESAAILKKMEDITIPEIEFRQANIHDVIDFLNKASQEGDKSQVEPKGVNIILNIGSTPAAAPAAAGAAEFGVGGGEGATPAAVSSEGITFTARFITLKQALDIITKIANLKYRVEGKVVMITRGGADAVNVDTVVIRMYPVEPTFMAKTKEVGTSMKDFKRGAGGDSSVFAPADANAAAGDSSEDLKKNFEAMGVPFPPGTYITYNENIGKVIVANTPENLDKFEAVLAEINVIPYQVEIEARFVEVNETQLEELGFEWLLNDNWELASQKSGASGTSLLSAQQRIVVNGNSSGGGFTKGLRFWGVNSGGSADTLTQGSAGSLLSISSVLTNPELGMILHALEQKGHADVLSAPKVTTRSGAEATIKVVTEYIYPTEFEVQGGSLQTGTGTTGGNAANVVQETVVVPQNFQTREVGVILTCTPQVSPNGSTIDLQMTPQVVTEPTWFQYGSVIRRADGSTQVLNMPQPFFHTRTVQTSISIYDGATVVMGGLITEQLQTIDDKIPFLGSLPLIGKLFQSSSQRSEKRNLLIFVTARLVNPAGKVIRPPDGDESKPMTATAAPAPTP